MAGQGYSWTLQFYMLLLLVQPLDPSSHPERDMGISGLLPKELEFQDLDPEPTPWVDMALVSWIGFLVELLITGVVLGRYLYRRLRRRWGEEERQSPSGRARPCCCRGCPRELIQLLRRNRSMMRLCLRYRSQQRPRAKRAAGGAIRKRKRLPAPLQC